MNRKYKITAILLVIFLCVSVIPGRVSAQDAETISSDTENVQREETIEEDTKVELPQPQPPPKEQADTEPAGSFGEEVPPEDTQPETTQHKDTPQAEISDVKEWPENEQEEQQPEEQSEMTEPEDVSAEDDDPGKGRLQGNVPAEFYDAGKRMRAMAAGIKHNSRFAGYDILNGVDVSKWNGTIKWAEVKNAGIDFAFVRTSYRGYEKGGLAADAYAASNMKNADAAGIKVGAYIFSQAISVKEAREEADYLVKSVKGYHITMPLVFDYEYYDGGRLAAARLSNRQRTDICLAFCERVAAAGYAPLVYANKSMLKDDLYASEISSKYPVWLAHYTSSTDYSGDYSFWQYTEAGHVTGINGNVDLNFWYAPPGNGTMSVTTPPKTKLSGKAESYDKVKLSWKKVPEASGYIIYRYNKSSSSYEKTAVINGAGTTSYMDTGRIMATTYKYYVRVYKTSGGSTAYSAPSNEVSVKTHSTMTGKTNRTSVPVRKGPAVSKGKLKTLGINTGVSITGTNGSWYRITLKVGGVKKTGYILKSHITIIRKPTLKLSSMSSDKIKLTWDKIPGASGYEIQRYHSSKKKYVTIKTIKKGSTASYTNSKLKSKTVYKYKIRSYKTVNGRKIYSYYCSAKKTRTK